MNRPALFLSESLHVEERLLSAVELARASAMRSDRRRSQFLAARTLLRRGLSFLMGAPPESFSISSAEGSAPALAGEEMCLSISHSGPMVACLVSAYGPCGVDVEDASVERDFASLGQAAFRRHRPWTRADFYAAWCAKEASLKAGENGEPRLFTRGSFQGALVLPRWEEPCCWIWAGQGFESSELRFRRLDDAGDAASA